ncbi:MAG: PQQ-binding-like beta-propeller repeat protein [Gaiellaceae bacterium]
MTRVRRLRPALLLAAVALALGVAACSGEDEGEEESRSPPQAAPETEAQEAPAPPPAPETAVRVLDGDTSKPVAGARVVVQGQNARTSDDGVAELGAPRGRKVTVRVSARGYGTEAVRLSFRERRAQKVRLWRPSLQWPMYGVNPARTQVHSGIKLRPPFRVVWKRNLRSLLEFSAIVWNGVAYVSNIDGFLYALSMKSGRTLWRKRVGTRMASSPGLDPKRRVLVTTSMSPGDVKVVSMDTGRVRWRFSTGRAEPSPVIRNGIAYFGAANGNVYALDLDRRRPRWTFRGGVKITGSPTLVGNRLYIGDYSGRVFALNVRTGRVIWTGSAGTRVYGTVAVAGGRVFAPSVFSGMSALSARTGRRLWRIPIGAYTYSSPAVFRNRVYFGTYEGLVYCVNARSGRILWTRPAGGRVSGAVQVVAGVVYAASIDNRTTAWHWRTGRQVWSSPYGEYVPISGNGERLLLHGAKRIWALDPRRRR